MSVKPAAILACNENPCIEESTESNVDATAWIDNTFVLLNYTVGSHTFNTGFLVWEDKLIAVGWPFARHGSYIPVTQVCGEPVISEGYAYYRGTCLEQYVWRNQGCGCVGKAPTFDMYRTGESRGVYTVKRKPL